MVTRGLWAWIVGVSTGLLACSEGRPPSDPLAARADGGACGEFDTGFMPGVDASAAGPGAVASSWESVGSPSATLPPRGQEVWALGPPAGGPDGGIVAAWFESSQRGGDAGIPTFYVRAARLEGSSWTELTSSSGEGVVPPVGAPVMLYREPVPAISPTGEVIVAWWMSTADGHEQLHVRRHDGHDWGNLGQEIVFDALGEPERGLISIAFRSDGSPVIAFGWWQQIHVVAWDGSGWAPWPDPAVAGVVASLELALDASDRPVIASILVTGAVPGMAGSRHVAVARFENGEWSPLGGASAPSIDEAMVPLRLLADGRGRLILAFLDNALGTRELKILRLEGTEWTDVSRPASWTERGGYDIATQGSDLILVWSEGDSLPFTQRGLRLTETGWQGLTAGCSPSLIATRFGRELDLGTGGGTVFLAGENAASQTPEVLRLVSP